jgi:hypothetical protein
VREISTKLRHLDFKATIRSQLFWPKEVKLPTFVVGCKSWKIGYKAGTSCARASRRIEVAGNWSGTMCKGLR